MSDMLLSTTATTPLDARPRFEALPYSDRCRQVWRRGDHLLIGVSPGNSYFSHQRIAQLLLWGAEFFRSIDIVYADLHVDTQFAAFGYSPDRALRRATKEIKTTHRRIQRGVEEAGTAGVRVRALSEFQPDPVYQGLHRSVLEALGTDRIFRDATEGMARAFLGARLTEGGDVSPAQLAAGVAYIAAELPFFLDTPRLLGVPTSVSCYHVQLPLTPVLFGRNEGLRAVPEQGYAVIRPLPEQHTAAA
ncbi:tRNA-dependent cyclodipeptide synthase [Kitasatospora sp. MAP5-34]|uniref:tRNA-dependent cyclodipeptide synthase n=1 Tax=Kitasatospora sp. MAP5-34 TaxID=3035102 RepID=UPI00247703A7|nr:tRNA-dependent cyclodipeptide synthase [Kitasatospora sp. MAP5-34]MDH6575271.1 cyclo(L-tyrosyl-L-tyrosyl) synthase [Kitasatospora sp. MAP5-34]